MLAKNEVQIVLPTLHEGQIAAYSCIGRFIALRCGRRWGKTLFIITIICDEAIRGKFLGFFAPNYKIMAETYQQIYDILRPVIIRASKMDGVIRLRGGGRIDFWTLNNEQAGRSRKYHGVFIDEGAFADKNMMEIWRLAIKPTLLDYAGYCWVCSTPNGSDIENFFYRICTEKEHGFIEYHAPTSTNPYLPKDEIEKLSTENAPLVFRQEYEAEFVDWSGAAFFSLTYLLLNDMGVPYPTKCDQVFAVIDTAVKDGLEHDGTAVMYFATNRVAGIPLIILDWEVIQITGDLLINWLPTVEARCKELAILTKARYGNCGIWVEDKQSGTILIQQGKRRNMNVNAIEGDLTSMGKDGRAISVSSYVYKGSVKLSQYAYDKTSMYKEQVKNHFLSQVCGYKLGCKTPHQMDLFDTFCYGIAIALGNSDGY